MKKVLLSAFALILSVSMYAIGYVSGISITLFDGDSEMPECNIAVPDGSTPDQTNTITPEDNAVAVYAIYNDAAYDLFKQKETGSFKMKNIPLGIKTNGSTSYELWFNGMVGDVVLYDKEKGGTGGVVDVNSDYSFTISESQKNSRIDDRFVLYYIVEELEVCFKNNKLQISSNPYTDGIVVKKDGVAITGSPFSDDVSEIDLSGASFATGRYTVEFGGGKAGGGEEFVVIKE